MKEMSFTPSALRFRVGSVVTLRFTNDGSVLHEAVVGDETRQNEHEAAALSESSPTSSTLVTQQLRSFRAHPGMSDPNAVQVEPGQSKDLTFSFSKPVNLIIGCHVPGHYAAGMKGTIEVYS